MAVLTGATPLYTEAYTPKVDISVEKLFLAQRSVRELIMLVKRVWPHREIQYCTEFQSIGWPRVREAQYMDHAVSLGTTTGLSSSDLQSL